MYAGIIPGSPHGRLHSQVSYCTASSTTVVHLTVLCIHGYNNISYNNFTVQAQTLHASLVHTTNVSSAVPLFPTADSTYVPHRRTVPTTAYDTQYHTRYDTGTGTVRITIIVTTPDYLNHIARSA